MASQRQVEEARVRLAFLLRSMLRRVDRTKIGADRMRNLGTEMADALRAITVASRTTMQFITSLAQRFQIELSEGSYEADGEDRNRRACAGFIPEALAGDLPGTSRDGLRIVPWAIVAQHTPLEAIRITVNDGPDFFVTFAQTRESDADADYFRMPEEQTGPRWVGVLPGEGMQSPKQHRAWFQVVSPSPMGMTRRPATWSCSAGNVRSTRSPRSMRSSPSTRATRSRASGATSSSLGCSDRSA